MENEYLSKTLVQIMEDKIRYHERQIFQLKKQLGILESNKSDDSESVEGYQVINFTYPSTAKMMDNVLEFLKMKKDEWSRTSDVVKYFHPNDDKDIYTDLIRRYSNILRKMVNVSKEVVKKAAPGEKGDLYKIA